jgi:amino-acid N-acetyltransferase
LTDVTFRPAGPADAAALHALVSGHVKEGHLLPRSLDELTRHATRFVVGEAGGEIVACAELAPLSRRVAEVRSLVVSKAFRRGGLAGQLIDKLGARARAIGFETLCAFTHDARFFLRQNFSIVPHDWLPEKISTDCVSCPLFRTCGQLAMILPLELGRTMARPAAQPAAVRRKRVA